MLQTGGLAASRAASIRPCRLWITTAALVAYVAICSSSCRSWERIYRICNWGRGVFRARPYQTACRRGYARPISVASLPRLRYSGRSAIIGSTREAR